MNVDFSKVIQRLMARNSELTYNITVQECLIEQLIQQNTELQAQGSEVKAACDVEQLAEAPVVKESEIIDGDENVETASA